MLKFFAIKKIILNLNTVTKWLLNVMATFLELALTLFYYNVPNDPFTLATT